MILLNGQLVEPGAPEVSLLNRSFKYGDGLFETFRVYQGHLLFVERHFQRLRHGLDRLGYEYDEAWLLHVREELTRSMNVNSIHNHGRVRLQVYRAGTGTYAPTEDHPYYLIEAYALKYDPYQEPVSLSMTVYRDWSIQQTVLSGCKTASALPYVLAARHARVHGYDEALLLSGEHVAEASSSNVFFVSQRKLFTPPLEVGCLPGIMREVLIQVAREVKIPVQEKKFRLRELQQADEVMLTNVIRGIQPVSSLDKKDWTPSPSPITVFLQNCLHQYLQKIIQ